MDDTSLPYTPEQLNDVAELLAQVGEDYAEDPALVEAVARGLAQAGAPAPGHNRPPVLSLNPLELSSYLAERLASVKPRYDELEAAYGRWAEAYAAAHKRIADDDALGNVAIFEKQLRGHATEMDRLREADRAPIRAAGDQVQGTYKGLIDTLIAHADIIRDARTAYLRAKEAEARAEREKAARAAEAEARRLAEEAAKRVDEASIAAAISAEEAAATAATAARASAADLARVRTDVGVTSSLRRKLAFKVIDKAKVPLQYMQVVDAAVLAAARVEKDPTTSQPIPGVEFYYETTAR